MTKMHPGMLVVWLCSFLPLYVQAYTLPPWHSRNYRTISEIYNLTVYPKNVGVFGNGTTNVPAGLFNENATGRISPAGVFNGFQDSVEYFFGLSPRPQQPGPGVIFSSAQVVEFASACPKVASSTVYFTTSVYDPGQPDNGAYISTLKQVAYWHFDEHGAVLKYDAWIPNLSNWSAVVTGGNAAYNPQLQAATIQGLCGGIQQRCVGSNTQYSSVADCISTLSQKPYGNLDEAWGDDVVCRTIHFLLTAIRPNIHCPHVGPTGGGKCIDISYNDAYLDDVALFGESLAKTFICPLNF